MRYRDADGARRNHDKGGPFKDNPVSSFLALLMVLLLFAEESVHY
jgi:hypothetical protein